jgi:hypothetical protein
VRIQPILLAQVPGADMAFNITSGFSREFSGDIKTAPLPEGYWQNMQALFSDFRRSAIPLRCQRCNKMFGSAEMLVQHSCSAVQITTIKENNVPKEDKPDPLAEEEQEWVVRAVKRRMEGTAPDPGTEKVDETGKVKIRRGSSEKVFGAILEHQGGAVTVQQLQDDTGLTRQQVHNGCHYLWTKGIIIRRTSGIYQAHPDVVKLSERVNVDVRHYDVTEQAVPAAAQRPQDGPQPPDGTDTPPVAQRPAQIAQDGADDVIESVLDLLRPEGFKARHLPAINAWIEATRELLRVTES